MFNRKIIYLLIVCFLSAVIGFFYVLPKQKIVIDVHGSHVLKSEMIKEGYSQSLNALAWFIHDKPMLSDKIRSQMVSKLMAYLANDIKKRYKVYDIYISPILYPNDEAIYITFDVLDNAEVSHPGIFFVKSIEDPDGLIRQWDEYESKGYAYFRKYHQFPQYSSCSANHCLFGFDLPVLKEYENVFNSLVEKNKYTLIKVLREDKDSHKRATSAFLIAHLKNPQEVISILLPAIRDPDREVRNNVLRVIGIILINNKNIEVSMDDLKGLLDLPLVTDRNKVMLILLGLADHVRYHHLITKQFGRQLYAELIQHQPNNHYLSSIILRKVSGQSYQDTDYTAWREWLLTHHVSIKS